MSETKTEDRKIFLGMLSRKINEDDLKVMFSPYGTIEELTILRNPDGTSKGCAFIKYANRLQAQNAIRAMHNSQTMDGCSSPLVVKIADTEKDKLQKRMQAIASNLFGLGMSMGQFGLGSGLVNGSGSSLQQSTYYQQLLSQLALPNTQLTQLLGNPSLMNTSSALPGGTTLNQLQLAAALATQQLQSMQQQQQQPQPQQNGNSSFFSNSDTILPSTTFSSTPTTSNLTNAALGGLQTSLTGTSQLSGLNGGSLSSMSTLAAALPQMYSSLQRQVTNMQPQKEGPEGSNLFIYHLPPEFTDADLMQTFMPFGNVISAKVFIDKPTVVSKCFGFVSYDNPVSAQAAINAMHGFTIGSKRLKVQLKRPKDQNKSF